MINKYTNKQRGLLAVIMAMVMVFAGAAFVAAEVDGAKITYISGEIMDDQTYGQGAIVVMNGDLTVEDGKSLIIAQGASFTVEAGYTLTISEDASLVVLNGAYFNAIGDVVVETNGSIENNSIYDATTKVDGKIAGFFINGNVTLEDGAKIVKADELNVAVEITDSAVPANITVHPNAVNDSITGSPITDGYRLTGTASYHINGAGNYGYWIGVKVGTTIGADKDVKVTIDGRTVDDKTDANQNLYFWTTAGKSVIISYEDDGENKKFILDATAVTIADESPAGQIIVNGSLTTESKTKTHSVIVDQIISVSKDASFTLEGDAENTIVNAFTDASKDVYTYGSIVLDSDYGRETTNGTGNVMDLKITTVQEKIPVAYADEKKITKAYNLVLDISGTIAGAEATDVYTPTISVVGTTSGFTLADNDGEDSGINAVGIVRVSGNLDVSEYAAFETTAGSVLDVDGAFTVSGKKGALASLMIGGITTVSGNVSIANIDPADTDKQMVSFDPLVGSYVIIDGDGIVTIEGCDITSTGVSGIYGAAYENDDVIYLTNLSKALEGVIAVDIDEMYLMGIAGAPFGDMPYVVTADTTVVDGLELILMNAIMIDEGITVTVEDGAELSTLYAALIVVDGTLIDYNMDDALVYGTTATPSIAIDAEVKAIDAEETYYKYTTLSNALSTAVDGETIQLFGDVTLKDNLTIPAGITVDTNNCSITVPVNKVLTVDGTLDMVVGGSVILKTALATNTWDSDGKIIVNNIVVSPNIVNDATPNAEEVKVAGIYADGTIGDYEDAEFLLAPAVAAENSSAISNATVDAETTYIGDLTFTAGEDNTAILTVNSKFTVGTITIVGYEIIISNVDSDNDSKADAIFTGKVAATNGVLDLKSVKPTTDDTKKIIIANVVDEDAGTDVLTIAGTPVMVDKDGGVATNAEKNVASISIASGTVTVDKSAILDVSNLGFTVAEGTVLDVNGTVKFNKMTITGTANINGVLTSTNGVLEVLGTLSVKQKTADDITEGSVTVTGDVYVGVLKKSVATNVTAGTATIDAAKINSCNVMYVAAGSSIPEELVEEADSIQFVIEDSLYITAYQMNAGSASATVEKAPVENAKFLGWNDDKGKLITDGATNPVAVYSIPFATYDKVTAAIDYNIYTVNIVADNGIGTVAIDGIVLQKNGNTFSASKLVAGEHTLSYELKNGYEGTVKMTVDGKAVDGYKFTLSGTDAEDLSIDINLSGTTQIEYSTATDSGEEDGGMTLVEILLIVLVVLVVILAIIVALRMMRS